MTEQFSLNFNADANRSRDITLLVGICSGIAADGVLTDGEVSFLETWILAHENINQQWPADQILDRIKLALLDGVIVQSEREDLLGLISSVARNEFNETGDTGYSDMFQRHIPDDADDIDFTQSFCFTGVLAYGTREICHFVTKRVGAKVDLNPTQKTGYLVVGQGANPDWKHGAFGTKINKVLGWRKKSGLPKVIHEKSWVKAIAKKGAEVGLPDLRSGFRNPKRRDSTVTFSKDTSFAEGWFFNVHSAFRGALDICYIENDKKSGWFEGDPPMYHFRFGDTFQSSNSEKYLIQLTSDCGDTQGDFKEIKRGKVYFKVFKAGKEHYEQLGEEEYSCSTVDFAYLLKNGELRIGDRKMDLKK